MADLIDAGNSLTAARMDSDVVRVGRSFGELELEYAISRKADSFDIHALAVDFELALSTRSSATRQKE